MKRVIKASTSSEFESWTEAYDLMLKVVDMYMINGPKSIDLKVEQLNSVFKGDRNWDEAYNRWHDSFDEEYFSDEI